MFKIIVFCALFGVIYGQTRLSQCINSRDAPLPLTTYVHGCIDPPCLLPQDEYVVIDLTFKAPRKLSNMVTMATANIFVGAISINIPYDLGVNAVTCDFFTNTSCPLFEGQVVKYQLRIMVERFFPEGTQATIEFRIVDNDKHQEVITCLRLPIRVIPAGTKS